MGNSNEIYVSPAFEELDNRLMNEYPTDEPGMAILVVQDGRPLLRKGYGLASLEWQIPVLPNTVFRIGSVTKQFTAVLTLMLMEQGKLALQDPIEKFIPDYPTHGHRITVEHLLTHTSGIKSYTGMKSWAADWGKNFSLNELIDYFKYQPMDFAPGQKWAYCNSGFVLLGAIIEKCAGMSYSQFLQESICKPLEMTSTWLELPGLLIPRRAEGYSKGPMGYQPAPYISMTQPLAAGGMVSTVEDLAAWDAALYGEKLIRAENLRRAQTPYLIADGSSTHYGYGWEIHEYKGIEVIRHSGGIHGFLCDMLRVPSQRVFVAVLTNCDDPTQSPGTLSFRTALQVMELTHPEPLKIEPKEADLLKFSGQYEVNPDMVLTISYQEGELWMTWRGQNQPIKLASSAVDELFEPGNPFIRYKLLPNETGAGWWIESRDQYHEVRFKAKKL